MRTALDHVFEASQKYDVSMRIGAYAIAIDKIASALRLRGIYA
jgi:glutamate dehydrogenase (NAD(P)+)